MASERGIGFPNIVSRLSRGMTLGALKYPEPYTAFLSREAICDGCKLIASVLQGLEKSGLNFMT